MNFRQVAALPIPYVDKPIQTAITNVKAICDKAIEQFRQTIVAKSAFKRGLMQDLLTGRRRFSEFGPAGTGDEPPVGWKAVQLQEAADIRVSTVDKHSRGHHIPVRLCNYMDVWTRPLILEDHEYMRSTASPDEVERFGLKAGDVLLTKDSETREEIGEPSFVVEAGPDLVLGYHCALIRPATHRVLGHFLSAQLRHPRFRRHFVRAAQGASRYGLTMETLRQAPLWLPSPAEQARISDVDWHASQELELLKAELRSYEDFERGLMQRLLSGEIKLPQRFGTNV